MYFDLVAVQKSRFPRVVAAFLILYLPISIMYSGRVLISGHSSYKDTLRYKDIEHNEANIDYMEIIWIELLVVKLLRVRYGRAFPR